MRALTKPEFLSLLQKFLPSGAAWPRALGSVLGKLLASFAAGVSLVDLRLQQLLVELNPTTSVALLAEWEAFVASNDECCSMTDATLSARQRRVISRLTDMGGTSKGYFLQLAADLGYADTTITEHRPTHCEMSCEAPLMDEAWRFVWEVNLPHESTSITTQFGPTHCEMNCEVPVTDVVAHLVKPIGPHSVFQVDSRSDERVDSYKFGALECMFMRLKPAHTYVMFSYRGLA